MVQEFNISKRILFVATTPNMDKVSSNTFCDHCLLYIYFSFPELKLWLVSNQMYVFGAMFIIYWSDTWTKICRYYGRNHVAVETRTLLRRHISYYHYVTTKQRVAMEIIPLPVELLLLRQSVRYYVTMNVFFTRRIRRSRISVKCGFVLWWNCNNTEGLK